MAEKLTEVPVVVFVNRKSGGQRGGKILEEFRALLPAEQVYCLQDGGPAKGLKYCHDLPTIQVDGRAEKARLIVAGGDGTVGWVVNGMDDMNIEDKSLTPVAHLPLGTGNDMARATGWGGGYEGGNSAQVVKWVRAAKPHLLDRWSMTIKGTEEPVDGEREELKFYNYFSLGVDARVAMLFHQMREKKPQLFRNRALNKFWYLKSGLQASLKASPRLSRVMNIQLDKEDVHYPNYIRTIIGLNIQSYMAGSDIWGTERPYSPAVCCIHPASDFADGSMGDGKIDLVGISSAFKQGVMKSLNITGVRIGQAHELIIECPRKMYVQADGEPWKVSGPFKMTVRTSSPATMLIKQHAHKKMA